MNTKNKLAHSLSWFGIIALLVSSFIVPGNHITLAEINSGAFSLPASAETLAKANGMQVLGGSEFALLKQETGEGTGNKISRSLTLSDGQSYSFESDKTGVTYAVESNQGVNTYIKAAPESFISKLSPDLTSLVEKSALTPVIIQFNIPGPFYRENASPSEMADKQAVFNATKDQVYSLANSGGTLQHKTDLPIINGVAANIDKAALATLSNSSLVKSIEEDKTVHILLDTSVDEIRARDVWPLFDGNNNPLTGVGKRIAVIDTGVDYTHPDLGGCFGSGCKVIGGYDFANSDADPMDDNGHGTHVAATAAGKGLLNGVAPDANILAYKVCSSGGSCNGSAIIAALGYAVDPNRDGNPADHVDVATISIGGAGSPDDGMSLAVDNTTAAGVVVTVAAGNSGPTASTIASPGAARTAITVAAACKAAQVGVEGHCALPIASFSSRGPLIWNGVNLQKPDIAAPGVLICAARTSTAFAGAPTCFDEHHIRISGTSMATPHVAGSAALLRQAYPNYSPQQIKDLLKNSARNLGQPYDVQGAGMVNVSAAIPGSPKVISTPATWTVTSDPTTKLTSQQQTFSVRSVDPTISTLDLRFSSSIPGVTFTPSKSQLQVPGQTPDTFQATLTIDNDLARSGSYFSTIIFSVAGVTKGIIPVYITVKPTLVTTPADVLDFDVDNPSLGTWTSDLKQVTVQNLRLDLSQSVNVTKSTYPSAIIFNTVTKFTVPAGGSTSFGSQFVVTNSKLANGIYTGTLNLSTVTNSVTLTTKFAKFYKLVLQDSDASSLANAMVFVHDRTATRFIAGPGFEKSFYLNTPSTYDVVILYGFASDPSGVHLATVFKEGLSMTGGTTVVPVSRSDATVLVQTFGSNITGAPVGPLATRVYYERYLSNPGLFSVTGFAADPSGRDVSTNYFTPVSSNYTHKEYTFSPSAQPAVDEYFFHAAFTGLQGNLLFTNTPADFKVFNVQHNINRTGSTSPELGFCTPLPGGQSCTGGFYNPAASIPTPGTQKIYSLLPPGDAFYQVSDRNKTGCSGSGACPYLFFSPVFTVDSKQRWADWLQMVPLPAIQANTEYNGLGPSVWFSKFQNGATTVQFQPYYYLPSSPQAAMLRQDYSLPQYDAIPYSLYKAGAQVGSGSLPAFLPDNISSRGQPLGSINLTTPGSYELRTTFPYQILGQAMTGSVVADFDTSLADPNPPAFKRLYYFSGGARSEVHDSAVANRLEFELDPIGGTMGQVQVNYSPDNSTFLPLPVSNTSGVYSADIPAVGSPIIYLRVSGVDDSGNALSYTFALPVRNPIIDNQPPVTAITSPTDGQAVSGTVAINATATDNIGVSKVEFYRDSSVLIGTDTSAPYSVNWDASAAGLGNHTLYTKAYDTVGNTATSALVTVSVNQDGIAPTVALTEPANGAQVGGTVTVSATASDNVGVTKVEFYLDGSVLLGTDTAAPYSMTWDATATLGSHTLVAKAYDAAGNIGTSSVNTVTVTDTISPTTAITSPTNGASVTKKTTVTIIATATDNVGVTKLEFYVNNTLTCTSTGKPYSCVWSVPATAGVTYALQTKAYDAVGNIGVSPIVSVTAK